MTVVSEEKAYEDILAHIKKQGGDYKSWYAGITSDVKQRLFTEHKVPEKNAWRIHRQCADDIDSRKVEADLLELGCDGGDGGGDSSAVYVYAYLKTSQTTP